MSDFKNCHKIYEGFLYFPLNEAKDVSAYAVGCPQKFSVEERLKKADRNLPEYMIEFHLTITVE